MDFENERSSCRKAETGPRCVEFYFDYFFFERENEWMNRSLPSRSLTCMAGTQIFEPSPAASHGCALAGSWTEAEEPGHSNTGYDQQRSLNCYTKCLSHMLNFDHLWLCEVHLADCPEGAQVSPLVGSSSDREESWEHRRPGHQQWQPKATECI